MSLVQQMAVGKLQPSAMQQGSRMHMSVGVTHGTRAQPTLQAATPARLSQRSQLGECEPTVGQWQGGSGSCRGPSAP